MLKSFFTEQQLNQLRTRTTMLMAAQKELTSVDVYDFEEKSKLQWEIKRQEENIRELRFSSLTKWRLEEEGLTGAFDIGGVIFLSHVNMIIEYDYHSDTFNIASIIGYYNNIYSPNQQARILAFYLTENLQIDERHYRK